MNPLTTYQVRNATPDDFPFICDLFRQAIEFQKMHNYTGWKSYDVNFIRRDIENHSVYKIVSDQDIICVFSVYLADPLIWGEKEKGDALYLHRIILNRAFAGSKSFEKVFRWSISFAREKRLKFIRMDTWADNDKIIGYYKSYGFRFIENFRTSDTADLPEQHRNLNVALLEYEIPRFRLND